ncbi:BspA family leucine-rich repeat surface protein, partial [Brachyspira pilosicoli]|nr:BspA family leucine-rich repeat surface protein [Brachyspira pilosicoli]
DIGSWNVFSAISMSYMFSGAESFNRSIENWTINKSCDIKDIFSSSYNDMKSILKIYFIAKGNYKKQLLSMLENCDIKEVYKEVLKYNKLKDFIK